MNRDERGSVTLAALGVVGVLVTCLIAGCALIAAMTASHRARSTADLAALAAAGALNSLVLVGDPCALANETARRNGGRIVQCAMNGEQVVIRAEVSARWPGLGAATAVAKAGPAPVAAGP